MNVSGQIATTALTFSYDLPAISQVLPATGSTQAGDLVVVSGTSLGATAGSATIGGNAAGISAWGHSSVTLIVPAGEGTGRQLILTTAAGFPSNALSFSYKAPVISFVNPSSLYTGGGPRSLTITGTDFGVNTPSVKIGSSLTCAVTSTSYGQIICTVPNAQGKSQPVQVTVAGQQSNIVLWSYSDPTLVQLIPSTGPSAGGFVLRVNGTSFGTQLALSSVVIGGLPCNLTSIADSSLTCVVPPLQGVVDVRLTVGPPGLQQPSNTLAFTFDSPQIVSIVPSNSPALGGGVLVIHGKNFGTGSGFATVGGLSCPTISLNHTHLLCTIPPNEDGPFRWMTVVHVVPCICLFAYSCGACICLVSSCELC